MTAGQGDIFGADLLLRVGVDASGAAAEVTSKLTAAERAAVASGDRIAAGYAQGAEKATVAQLRVVAATERVNKVLRDESATLGQRASAQASLISAQSRYTTELNKTERAAVAVGRAERSRTGFLRQSLAAGVGIGGTQLLLSQISQAKAAAVDYQDVVSANQVTFGRQRKQIDVFKRTQADELNISKLQAESLANTFGSIFKTAGASPADALSQGLELTKRAADVRSFRGGQLKDVADAFRSALVGETEPIRRYGVLLDDSRLRLRALDLGLVKSTKETLPPAIKAQAAYAEILAQTTDAQGDVARTSDQATNKIEDQRQKAADARLELGQGLLPVISELAQAGSELAPALAGVARGLSAVLSNDLARRAIYLGVAAGGIVKLTSAVQGFGARTAERITANFALAGSYDRVAGSATRAAIAEGAAAGGGVAGGGRRGQLGLLGPLLLGAGLTGSVGAATGRGDLNSLATIGGGALLGGQMGSFIAPGIGTAIGAGIGGAAGITAALIGGNGTSVQTSRTRAQVRADIARVDAQMARLQSGGAENATLGFQLRDRRNDLAKELKAASAAARETAQVVDPLTGKFKNMTKAQIEAANATAIQTKELQALKDQFRVSAFSGDVRAGNITQARTVLRDALDARDRAAGDLSQARTGGGAAGATSADIHIAELRLQSARDRAAKNGATPSEQASVLSAQQRLNDLRTKGKATAEQTATAERRVADAIRSQRDAQEKVNAARKALDAAMGTSAKKALSTARDTLAYQRDLRHDYRSLSRRGLSLEGLQELAAQEGTSPGTVDRIEGMGAKAGRRWALEYSKTVAEISRTTDATAEFFRGAEDYSAQQGRRMARRAHRAFVEEIAGYDWSSLPGGVPAGIAAPPRAPSPKTLPNKLRSGNMPTP